MPRSEPYARDAARTRARILARAADVFARKGFEGTTIRDVTDAAEVNRRMIYHYFGDKGGLYRAIFVQAWEDMRAAFAISMAGPKPAGAGRENPAAATLCDVAIAETHAAPAMPTGMSELDGLLVPVGAFFDFLVARPSFVRLMMWEALEGGHISRSIWAELREPVFRDMASRIEAARARGALDASLDPAHVVVSLMGAISFYFAYAPTLEQVFGREPLGEPGLAERRAQMVALARALLA